jgi:hypothetical protein
VRSFRLNDPIISDHASGPAATSHRMPLLNHEIVGTIALSPASFAAASRPRISEETTLGDLLAALAICPSPSVGDAELRCLVTSSRISRFVADDGPAHASIRADVSRLADQLTREYATVAGI